jgi:peptidoglycan hydrolase-like protein with peptidoglycan-binding domain/3D (Asp-Asp-Asp) domain-containing protein
MKRKNKNSYKSALSQLLKRISIDACAVIAGIVLSTPLITSHVDYVFADELSVFDDATDDASNDEAPANDSSADSYPYSKTFIISAYYSPLPCQMRYVTGSYNGDIRLNGGGKRGADGTSVYPGMIAAPRTYDFGTKMDIPEVGIVAVHDRGGAIRPADGSALLYDRLDIWMGYGDKGLERALRWGKRTFEVVVYGPNDSIQEQISLSDYSPDEATPNDCSQVVLASVNTETVANAGINYGEAASSSTIHMTNMVFGSMGEEVKALQTEFKNLNFYRGEITGFYGELTQHAVFKFQQSQMLVRDKDSQGAGNFGPKTRDRLNEITATRRYSTAVVADKTLQYEKMIAARSKRDQVLASELRYGTTGSEVSKLQRFLKDKGFFEGVLITEYYGPVTKEAVLKFQKANNIIISENDTGAGDVGPSTLEIINTFS